MMHQAGEGREMKNDGKNSSAREKHESSILLHIRLHRPVRLWASALLLVFFNDHLAHYEVERPRASRPVVRNRRAAPDTASRAALCSVSTSFARLMKEL